MRVFACLIAFLCMIINTGCQGNSVEPEMPEQMSPASANPPLATPQPTSSTHEKSAPDRFEPRITRYPERIPPTEAIAPVTGEVPNEILDVLMRDLAKRAGADPESITLILAQSMVWDDGSLGCPQPGNFYTQAPVNGYRVVFEVSGQKYDYRVTEAGIFFVCENEFDKKSGAPH